MTDVVIVAGLVVLGLLLLGVELFVIPGFGLVGILGILSVLGAGAVAYLRLSPRAGGIAFAAGLALVGLMFWLLPRTRAARSMVLTAHHAGGAPDPGLRALRGQAGVALTPLRPAGSVEIAGRAVDVVTDGEFIAAGTRVRVTQVEGVRVVVHADGAEGRSEATPRSRL
jgi:membrane-bound serine protease (ClpP class)